MRKVAFLLIVLSKLHGQAFYYFNDGLKEYSNAYQPLAVLGHQGNFVLDVVPAFGNKPRTVYQFANNSGLSFINTQAGKIMSGSVTTEMYFKYNDGELFLFKSLMGDRVSAKQGQYIHYVTSRDHQSKRINIYLDSKLIYSTLDKEDHFLIDHRADIDFFKDSSQETTSGSVAMIKIYNKFIDETEAKELFAAFDEKPKNQWSNENGKIPNLFFVQSQSELLPESTPVLESIAEYFLANQTLQFVLEGHTDNVGDYTKNLNLSKERAAEVKKFLISRGVASKRIHTRGFGSMYPIASNAAENTRRLNRRVELKVF